jgi:hypothetical protein
VLKAIKAPAGELPRESGVSLSRRFVLDLRREAITRGMVTEISDITIRRWLAEDAIRPWAQRSWIFSRHPDFEPKAGPVLGL